MNIRNISDESNAVNACTSCQLCSVVCPTKAIKIELNPNGFYRPVVDNSRCVNCGKCIDNCYKYDSNIVKSKQHVAAWACKIQTPDILKKTTSGGIAFLLADIAIKENCTVLGVAYESVTNRAVARLTETDVHQFRGSKYIQAYTKEAIGQLLKGDYTKAVVFGLPCQIYAIDKIAREKGFRKNLILIDLFCHGCPSMLLWDANIKSIKNKLGKEPLDEVLFRSKEKGWHEFCEYYRKGDKEYVPEGNLSPFYKLFFSNQLLNDACEKCKTRGTLAYGDIRLGDFWGWEYDEDCQGVSAVVAITDQGNNFLQKMPEDVFIKAHDLSDILKAQSFENEYVVDKYIRQSLLEALRNNDTIEVVEKRYFYMLPPMKRIKERTKRALSMLPRSVQYKIKKIVHSMVQ